MIALDLLRDTKLRDRLERWLDAKEADLRERQENTAGDDMLGCEVFTHDVQQGEESTLSALRDFLEGKEAQ